ncbi:MAG: SIMPL domain-containing protein [Caldilineales bacterium]|nr:SIMPL domain-containing protein [Caldilineales bacterium]
MRSRALDIAAADIRPSTTRCGSNRWWISRGVPTGETKYHVSNQCRVKVSDFDKTGEVLQAALAAGANTVAGVEFAISDPISLQQQARDKAMADAQAKAKPSGDWFQRQTGRRAQCQRVQRRHPAGGQ